MSSLACINSEFSVVLCATSLQTRTQCDAQLGPVSWWIAKASGMWGEWLGHKHDFNLVIHPISSLLRLLYCGFPAFRVCREGLCLRHNNQSEWMWPLCGTVGALINFDLARICMIFDFAQASEDDHHIANKCKTFRSSQHNIWYMEVTGVFLGFLGVTYFSLIVTCLYFLCVW